MDPSKLMPASIIANVANSHTSPFLETGFASTGFILLCSALVFLMTPGIGLFYSGLSRSKNVLTVIVLSFISYAVVSLQWLAFGFSLAYSDTGSLFLGDFKYSGLTNDGFNAMFSGPQIPIIAFTLYQLQFATVTVAIIFGAVAERVRIIPAFLFVFAWTTLIYDPVSYWTWSKHGWLRNLACLHNASNAALPCGIGAVDFAGGGPVHIASGFAGLAYAIMLGRRNAVKKSTAGPDNVTIVYLSTALLWFGWFGFNGGSAIGATPRAAMAAFVTTTSASMGGITWIIVDALKGKKISGIGFCTGAISGLIGITPASGYVPPWAAIVIGAVTAICCNFAAGIKYIIAVDDSLDAFSLHGIGGIVGKIMTGILAQKRIALLDGTIFNGGIIDGYPMQLVYQLISIAAISAYSFMGTLIILAIINCIPGMHIRASAFEEIKGGDLAQLGEQAHDWIAESHDFSPEHSRVISDIDVRNPKQVYPSNE